MAIPRAPPAAATPPAASPGKRGRRARFLLGFLRLRLPAAGSVGARLPGAAGGRAAGREQPQLHHVAAQRRPRRPGARGRGEGGANHSPPLPFHPARPPNSASQVTRARAPAGTYGRRSGSAAPRSPGASRRPKVGPLWLAGPLARNAGPFSAPLSSRNSEGSPGFRGHLG